MNFWISEQIHQLIDNQNSGFLDIQKQFQDIQKYIKLWIL